MTANLPDAAHLEDDVVRLEPLTLDHVPDLYAAAGRDETVWRWLPASAPQSEAEMTALAERVIAEDAHVPHAVILKESGRAIGWSAYCDVPGFDASLEIGWTWYAQAHWRGPVNTSCKILLLDHGFGLGFNRMLLKTDVLNLRSQEAIKRIGGVYEGTLRRHRLRPDGTWRDTVYFGLLAEEWPAHRERLLNR